MMRQEQETLWAAYRDGAEWARDALLTEHRALVYREALRLSNKRPFALELEDLAGAGMIGLMEAVAGFEPERGLAFSTFALPRIRGAILDHLRQWDPLSRSARRKERLLAQGRRDLTGQLTRAPTRPELAEHLDVDVDTMSRWELDAARGVAVSLDGPVAAAEGATRTLEEVVPSEDGDGFMDALNHAEEVALLREEVADLPVRDRQVLSLYYMECLTLREIGELLGVTESRVSQIRSAVVDGLRQRLGHLRAA